MSNRDIIILASVFSSSSPLSPGLNPPGVPAQKEEEPSRDHRVRVGHLATFLDVCVCVCVRDCDGRQTSSSAGDPSRNVTGFPTVIPRKIYWHFSTTLPPMTTIDRS